MASRVLITIDTELVWRHRAAGLDWRENFQRSFEAAGVGVPYQLRLLAEHELKACFFVDPMPALLHGPEPVQRMVEPILAAGQEVQLHLHPFWAHPERDFCELTAFAEPAQRELIERARELLVAAGAPHPIAFRAGSYAANADTLRALATLGFRYDSSHNGCEHPDPSALPFSRSRIAPIADDGIVEIPVGQIQDSAGRLRHLQLCAVSFEEMRAALLHARDRDHPLSTIVSHSFELASRDGLSVNGLAVTRFRRLCAFLAVHRDVLPTAHFGDLGEVPLDSAVTPFRSPRLMTLSRMAAQAWGNARYERPRRRAGASRHVG